MSKMDEVRAEMVKAMKKGDKQRKDVLSFLLSDLKAKWIDKRADLSEEEENAVIRKEIRQTRETLESAPKDRQDIISQSRFALSVLAEFAPKSLGEDEIRRLIREAASRLSIGDPTLRDRGRLMKEVMPKIAGRADGALVNRLVLEFCRGKQ